MKRQTGPPATLLWFLSLGLIAVPRFLTAEVNCNSEQPDCTIRPYSVEGKTYQFCQTEDGESWFMQVFEGAIVNSLAEVCCTDSTEQVLGGVPDKVVKGHWCEIKRPELIKHDVREALKDQHQRPEAGFGGYQGEEHLINSLGQLEDAVELLTASISGVKGYLEAILLRLHVLTAMLLVIAGVLAYRRRLPSNDSSGSEDFGQAGDVSFFQEFCRDLERVGLKITDGGSPVQVKVIAVEAHAVDELAREIGEQIGRADSVSSTPEPVLDSHATPLEPSAEPRSDLESSLTDEESPRSGPSEPRREHRWPSGPHRTRSFADVDYEFGSQGRSPSFVETSSRNAPFLIEASSGHAWILKPNPEAREYIGEYSSWFQFSSDGDWKEQAKNSTGLTLKKVGDRKWTF